MGGRGSLSSNKHLIYDVKSLRNQLKDSGIEIIQVKGSLTRKNLSLVRDIAEELISLQNSHGWTKPKGLGLKDRGTEDRPIKTLMLGLDRKGDLVYTPRLQVGKRSFKDVLIVPKKTLNKGLKKTNSDFKKAYKKGIVTSKNIKDATVHEYAHGIHKQLRRQNPQAHERLNQQLKTRLSTRGSRTQVSQYARIRQGKKEYSMTEIVAESFVNIQRGRYPRKGLDIVETVYNSFSDNFPKMNIVRWDINRDY